MFTLKNLARKGLKLFPFNELIPQTSEGRPIIYNLVVSLILQGWKKSHLKKTNKHIISYMKHINELRFPYSS